MADYIIGLDLAKHSDYSAISVLRRTAMFDRDTGRMVRREGMPLPRFVCQHIERHRGMSYPDLVDRVVLILRARELGHNPMLVMDATGLGQPVLDMFKDRDLGGRRVVGIQLTGGATWTLAGPLQFNVSKTLVVAATQVVLQSERLKIMPDLRLAKVAMDELLAYKVKITLAANEIYNAKDSDHDDICISLMLPIWFAQSPVGRGLLPSLADDETGVSSYEEAVAQRDEMVRRDKECQAEREAWQRGEMTEKARLEEEHRRRRREQDHADFDDSLGWDQQPFLKDAPAWFDPVKAQADYNPSFGRVPEPTHRISDLLGKVHLPWPFGK